MADYFWGRIEVGGELRGEDVPRFCASIGIEEPELIHSRWNGLFVHEDSEASGGQFDELEDLCRELGLPYIRQSDGKYECSPEVVFWIPGMEGPLGTLADPDGNLQASMDDVRAIRDALVADDIPTACFLADKAVVDLPELPAFTIQDRLIGRKRA